METPGVWEDGGRAGETPDAQGTEDVHSEEHRLNA